MWLWGLVLLFVSYCFTLFMLWCLGIMCLKKSRVGVVCLILCYFPLCFNVCCWTFVWVTLHVNVRMMGCFDTWMIKL